MNVAQSQINRHPGHWKFGSPIGDRPDRPDLRRPSSGGFKTKQKPAPGVTLDTARSKRVKTTADELQPVPISLVIDDRSPAGRRMRRTRRPRNRAAPPGCTAARRRTATGHARSRPGLVAGVRRRSRPLLYFHGAGSHSGVRQRVSQCARAGDRQSLVRPRPGLYCVSVMPGGRSPPRAEDGGRGTAAG